jgi:ABC-type antimicrobial peptide transport system permease subunit
MTGNEILGLLVGGDTLNPIANVGGVVVGVVLLAIVTLLAMIYPIIVARKITPLEAISRD